MEEIRTPLVVSQVCPGCHTFHIHNDCGYKESREDDAVSELVGSEEKRRGFLRKETYTGLGEESSFCGALVVLLNCVRYLHDYARRLFCGREWCKRCGLDESDMHKRRYARLMDKVFYLGSQSKAFGLGYFVFTVPVHVREKLRNKSKLQRAGRVVRNLLKQHGFEIGLSRWHFFGDGQITEGELNLGVYHPHLNCLVVGRWIYDRELKVIREAWRRYLEVLSGETIDVVDVWYQYSKEKSRWWHKAVYITRSTFKSLEGNGDLAKALYDFRNLCYWGFGKGFEREAKLKHGRVVLELWLQGVKESDTAIAKGAYEDLFMGTHMKCPQCAEQGHVVKMETAMNLDTGGRVICELESLLPRIKKELGAGFFVLGPIILSKKPMSSVEDDLGSLECAYDTS
jgi:hypothetical protein